MMGQDHGMSLGDYGSGLDYDAMLAAYGEAAEPDAGVCVFSGCDRTDTDLTMDWSSNPAEWVSVCPGHNHVFAGGCTVNNEPPRVTVNTQSDATLVAKALEDKASDCYTQAENHDNEIGRRFWQSRGDEYASLIGRIEVARW